MLKAISLELHNQCIFSLLYVSTNSRLVWFQDVSLRGRGCRTNNLLTNLGVVPMIEEYLFIREDFMNECNKLTSYPLRRRSQFFFFDAKVLKVLPTRLLLWGLNNPAPPVLTGLFGLNQYWKKHISHHCCERLTIHTHCHV